MSHAKFSIVCSTATDTKFPLQDFVDLSLEKSVNAKTRDGFKTRGQEKEGT